MYLILVPVVVVGLRMVSLSWSLALQSEGKGVDMPLQVRVKPVIQSWKNYFTENQCNNIIQIFVILKII